MIGSCLAAFIIIIVIIIIIIVIIIMAEMLVNLRCWLPQMRKTYPHIVCNLLLHHWD